MKLETSEVMMRSILTCTVLMPLIAGCGMDAAQQDRYMIGCVDGGERSAISRNDSDNERAATPATYDGTLDTESDFGRPSRRVAQ